MAKENNKDRILKLLKECKNHQTAESIAVQLNIQRNTASGILNELVREGIVQKEKTRPVIFSYIEAGLICLLPEQKPKKKAEKRTVLHRHWL